MSDGTIEARLDPDGKTEDEHLDTDDSTDGETGKAGSDTGGADLLLETSPTIKPVLIQTVLLLSGSAVLLGYLILHPESIGDRQLTNLVINALGVVLVLFVLRQLISILILHRTRYCLYEDTVRREYRLLYRYESREVPLASMTGVEVTRDRIQSLLGFGTVKLLTAGSHDRVGFVRLEQVEQPENVRERIRHLVSGG
jgi:membrane protein YdbS with pleckstrin-like domain